MKPVLKIIAGFILIIVVWCGCYYFGKPYAEQIKATSSALSIYMLIMSFLAGRELSKYKGKMCNNISYKSTVVQLKEIYKTLEKNKESTKKIEDMRTSMISEIIGFIEELFSYDKVLEENFSDKLKFIKQQKTITGNNISQIMKIINDIYEAAEKIHE